MEDSALTTILREVIRAADEESTVLTQDMIRDWPVEAIGWLEFIEVIRPGTNQDGLVCDECEERCWVIPERQRRSDGAVALIHRCEKRGDIGIVELSFDTLKTWRIDLSALAREIAETIELSGEVEVIVQGRLWKLGSLPAGKKFRRFYLGRGFHFDDAERVAGIADEHIDDDSFLFILDHVSEAHVWPNPSGSILRLLEVACVRDGELAIDDVELSRVLNKRREKVTPFSKPPNTSWENVHIRVLPPPDGRENSFQVELQAGRHREIRNFIEMGMFDGRKQPPEPNNAWTLLMILAENGGRLTWKDTQASTKARAHMKLLRHALHDLFLISGDPFKDYIAREGWRPRFNLVDLRNAP